MGKKIRTLIFGHTGYLGLYYVNREHKDIEFLLYPDRIVEDKEISLNNIDVILYLAVKQEYDKEHKDFFTINSTFPAYLSKIANRKNIQFIYISTEMVYTSDKAYTVIDQQNPKTLYGISKTYAENMIRLYNYSPTIIRTSLLYGYNHPTRHNLLKVIRDTDTEIHLYDDAYIYPTFIEDFTKFIDNIIINNIPGIFHARGLEKISRYDFGYRFAKLLNKEKYIKKALTPSYSNIEKNINIIPNIPNNWFSTNIDKGLNNETTFRLF